MPRLFVAAALSCFERRLSCRPAKGGGQRWQWVEAAQGGQYRWGGQWAEAAQQPQGGQYRWGRNEGRGGAVDGGSPPTPGRTLMPLAMDAP